MYYRIMHAFEAKLLLKEMANSGINKNVGYEILEQATILDSNYNRHDKRGGRNRNDFGGYVLFFPDEQSYEAGIVEIWDHYKISPELYEYADYIVGTETEHTQWIEKLYLINSDEGLVLIYPQERMESQK